MHEFQRRECRMRREEGQARGDRRAEIETPGAGELDRRGGVTCLVSDPTLKTVRRVTGCFLSAFASPNPRENSITPSQATAISTPAHALSSMALRAALSSAAPCAVGSAV
jgi:hypothetical protein